MKYELGTVKAPAVKNSSCPPKVGCEGRVKEEDEVFGAPQTATDLGPLRVAHAKDS
jgi:hypothetical protein